MGINDSDDEFMHFSSHIYSTEGLNVAAQKAGRVKGDMEVSTWVEQKIRVRKQPNHQRYKHLERIISGHLKKILQIKSE